MAIQYVGGVTASGAGSTTTGLTLSLTALTGGIASSPSEGDIIVVGVSSGSITSRTLTISTSGYSAITAGLYSNSSIDTNLYTFYKVMGSTPDTSLVTGPSGSGSEALACVVHVWRGVTSINSVTPTTATNGSGTGGINPPAITPTRTGSVVIAIGAACSFTQPGAVTSPDLSNFLEKSGNDSYDTVLGIGSYEWSSGSFDPGAWSGTNSAWAAVTAVLSFTVAPTVTTQAVTSIAQNTATGNGNVTSDGGGTITERGVCWSTSPTPTTASSKATSAGTTGAFTASITGLSTNTLYYVRAYAINSAGTSYGSEVTFTTLGWENPTNAYTSDGSYTTLPIAINGDIGVSLSKDGGSNYTTILTKTYDGTEGYQSYGNASTELWGSTWTGDDIDDTSFRLKISHNGTTQIYKNFGFALSSSQILTGIDVSVEAKYESGSTTISVDHIRIRVYYGTSVLPIQAGSMVYASNLGGGTIAIYNGSAWKYAALTDQMSSITNLHFGDSAVNTASRYLKGINGVLMTSTIGWVASRAGSIVGLSASFNCSTADVGSTVTFSVRKNGTDVFSSDAVSTAATGDLKTYKTQARDIDTFVAGDVISAYVTHSGVTAATEKVLVLVDVQFDI